MPQVCLRRYPERVSTSSPPATRVPLRILLVEDCDADAELMRRELLAHGYDVNLTRVQTADAMREALARERWQAVISDYSLPGFSGPAALAILKETKLDLPFIMVSGTVGEQTAVQSLKAGAGDFLLKDNLTRLGPALEREIREAARRRDLATVEQQLRRSQERST